MIAKFTPDRICGEIDAPPSKSLSHRYLIGAAISGQKCTLTDLAYSEDILASIDCLRALGADITTDTSSAFIESRSFMKAENTVLECRESGSTLRFLIPLALCIGKKITFHGSERLFERPLDVYEELCAANGFLFEKTKNSLTVCGELKAQEYKMRGNVSSQFISGLVFALVYLGKDASLEIIPPLESRPYIELTLDTLRHFGARVAFADTYRIEIKASKLHPLSAKIEGDYSNAAFLDVFNHIGSSVKINNLSANSLQGDRVYAEYFERIANGTPTIDVSNCPDLAPVLFALAALKNGAHFTGTDRLKIKESDRAQAMHEELSKLGGGLVFGENSVTVPKQTLVYRKEALDGHNDHRIVMALSVILSVTGGDINGAEAVKKSYPAFFDCIKSLGAKIELT